MPLLFIRTRNSDFHFRDEGLQYDRPHDALISGLQGAMAIAGDEVIKGEDSAAVEMVVEDTDGAPLLACRYAVLSGGRRQILALLVAGDVIDLRPSILGPPDHAVCTLTPCRLATIPAGVLRAWAADQPSITRAFARAALIDEAVLRQWLVSVGARRVEQRIAHVFLESLYKLQAVGLATRDSYAFAAKQDDLGAMVGGSLVHVCRILTQLRTDGVVQFRQGVVRIDDLTRLTALAEFDPGYLHLGTPPAEADRAVARLA